MKRINNRPLRRAKKGDKLKQFGRWVGERADTIGDAAEFVLDKTGDAVKWTTDKVSEGLDNAGDWIEGKTASSNSKLIRGFGKALNTDVSSKLVGWTGNTIDKGLDFIGSKVLNSNLIAKTLGDTNLDDKLNKWNKTTPTTPLNDTTSNNSYIPNKSNLNWNKGTSQYFLYNKGGKKLRGYFPGALIPLAVEGVKTGIQASAAAGTSRGIKKVDKYMDNISQDDYYNLVQQYGTEGARDYITKDFKSNNTKKLGDVALSTSLFGLAGVLGRRKSEKSHINDLLSQYETNYKTNIDDKTARTRLLKNEDEVQYKSFINALNYKCGGLRKYEGGGNPKKSTVSGGQPTTRMSSFDRFAEADDTTKDALINDSMFLQSLSDNEITTIYNMIQGDSKTLTPKGKRYIDNINSWNKPEKFNRTTPYMVDPTTGNFVESKDTPISKTELINLYNTPKSKPNTTNNTAATRKVTMEPAFVNSIGWSRMVERKTGGRLLSEGGLGNTNPNDELEPTSSDTYTVDAAQEGTDTVPITTGGDLNNPDALVDNEEVLRETEDGVQVFSKDFANVAPAADALSAEKGNLEKQLSGISLEMQKIDSKLASEKDTIKANTLNRYKDKLKMKINNLNTQIQAIDQNLESLFNSQEGAKEGTELEQETMARGGFRKYAGGAEILTNVLGTASQFMTDVVPTMIYNKKAKSMLKHMQAPPAAILTKGVNAVQYNMNKAKTDVDNQTVKALTHAKKITNPNVRKAYELEILNNANKIKSDINTKETQLNTQVQQQVNQMNASINANNAMRSDAAGMRKYMHDKDIIDTKLGLMSNLSSAIGQGVGNVRAKKADYLDKTAIENRWEALAPNEKIEESITGYDWSDILKGKQKVKFGEPNRKGGIVRKYKLA